MKQITLDSVGVTWFKSLKVAGVQGRIATCPKQLINPGPRNGGQNKSQKPASKFCVRVFFSKNGQKKCIEPCASVQQQRGQGE